MSLLLAAVSWSIAQERNHGEVSLSWLQLSRGRGLKRGNIMLLFFYEVAIVICETSQLAIAIVKYKRYPDFFSVPYFNILFFSVPYFNILVLFVIVSVSWDARSFHPRLVSRVKW